jgi:hypothetical protein
MGCIKVSKAEVIYKRNTFPPNQTETSIDLIGSDKESIAYWTNQNFSTININFEEPTEIDLKIKFSCDEEFYLPFEQGEPTKIPQTHFSQARNKEDYYVSNGDFEIKGKKFYEIRLERLSFSKNETDKDQQKNDLRLIANLQSCGRLDAEENNLIIYIRKNNDNSNTYELTIMGVFKNLSGSITGYLSGDAIIDCENILDKFEKDNRFVQFFENKINEENLLFAKKNIELDLLINFIGKSIIFKGKEGILFGKLRIVQTYQCEYVNYFNYI